MYATLINIKAINLKKIRQFRGKKGVREMI